MKRVNAFYSFGKTLTRTISGVCEQKDNAICDFLYSLYPVEHSTNDEKSLQECINGVIDNQQERENLVKIVQEIKPILCKAADGSMLEMAIKESPILNGVITPSKKQLLPIDYYLYYILYPYMASLSSYDGLNQVASFFMRLQSDKKVRASAFAPPLLQMKVKKMKKTQLHIPEENLSPEQCLSGLDLRVGKVVRAWNHPESEKLLCEEVDLGEGTLRSIGSGIRAFYSAEAMCGRYVCVLSNMKMRKLGGYPSNGMLLCASTPDHVKGVLVQPPENTPIGEQITFQGIESHPATPNTVHKKKLVETVLKYLHTDSNGVCCFKDIPFQTSQGHCTCPDFPNEAIS